MDKKNHTTFSVRFPCYSTRNYFALHISFLNPFCVWKILMVAWNQTFREYKCLGEEATTINKNGRREEVGVCCLTCFELALVLCHFYTNDWYWKRGMCGNSFFYILQNFCRFFEQHFFFCTTAFHLIIMRCVGSSFGSQKNESVVNNHLPPWKQNDFPMNPGTRCEKSIWKIRRKKKMRHQRKESAKCEIFCFGNSFFQKKTETKRVKCI